MDSVRRASNAQLDADSLAYVNEPDTVPVRGERALGLFPFRGDCQPRSSLSRGRGGWTTAY